MAASMSTTISNANNTTTGSIPSMQNGSNGPAGQKMPASEVGWLFVHEYYTFLNKDPSRLHCFYGQKSTLINGIEGEMVTPSQGEKEIKEKFQGLNLENCRVLVTNVDTQSSINGGILIQVLGEMSNRNEVARKFAQTFFLDEQPNGYYVLNDIIRFLSDDDIELYSGEEEVGTFTSPTGTLVEEPINVSSPRVEQTVPSQNTTITESAQVISRAIDSNMLAPSSKETKENETPLQTAVSEEVVDLDDNNRTHAFASASIIPNVSAQSSKLMANGQPTQSRSPLLSNVQNRNVQTVNLNEQESIITLTSQEAHTSGQTTSQLTPIVSTYIQQQPPAVITKQEPASVSANIESQSLQSMQSLLQENNGQVPKSTTDNDVASKISNSFPVEQNNNGQSVNISKQTSVQSPTVNASQRVVKVSSTQNNVSISSSARLPGAMQNKTAQPTKQIPAVNAMQQSQANSQPPISTNPNNVQIVPIPNNAQPQSVNASQIHANDRSPKSVIDNNIQLSSSRQKLSPVAHNDNNGQVANIARSQGKPVESPDVTQSPSVVNSKGHRVDMNTTQVDKKNNEQSISKNDFVPGTSDIQNNPQAQAQAPTKKTWASLAANETEKWSSSALAEAKGVVASVPAKSVAQQPPQHNRDRRSEGQKNNGRRNSDTSLSIYVKGVTPSMSYEKLKAAFMAFGQVKHLDVVHTKSCAFVEYNNADSYRRALEVHTVDVGSETVNTEERRPTRRNNGKAPRGRF